MNRVATHLGLLLALIVGITIVYARVTGAYFCAYDDFIEIHRAAFEDTRDPSRVFTTSHFNSYKYRPLNRAITLVTYWISDGAPVVFRIRNLSFHLLNVVLVYALGWLLFKSKRVSVVGATLFGLHPIANQTTIGAVWSSTMAHAGFLLAIVAFIAAIQRKRLLWLAGALLSGWLSLLMYDTAITVFGLMCVYLIVHLYVRRGEAVGRQFVLVFTGVAGGLIGVYFLLRSFFVPRGWAQVTADAPSAGIVLKNVAMYLFALASPVDSILANEVLGTPLPSEISLDRFAMVAVGGSGFVAMGGFSLVLLRLRRSGSSVEWPTMVFLASGILLPLLPVLAFSSHPSETYLYIPVAFYGLLLSYLLATLLVRRQAGKPYVLYSSVVLVLLILLGAATWVRNDRVVACAGTAHRILEGLPRELLAGAWTVSFANVPGEPATRRYGFYGFRGIDTIGHRSIASPAVSSALQLVYGNQSLKGEVLEPAELVAQCEPNVSSRRICLWVHWDGRVENVN